MGCFYLFSISSLVWIINKTYGFPAIVPSSPIISCTEAEEEITKRCGSLKLSEVLSSQGFTGPIMITPVSSLFLPVMKMINNNSGTFDKWDGNYFPSQFFQNISSSSSNQINCQLYERYTQCIDEHGIPDRCFLNEDFITRASYGYICGAGKDDYLQSANCLERMDDYNTLAHQSQAKAECQLNNVNLFDALYGMLTSYKATNMEQWLNEYLHQQEYLLCLIRERLHSCTGPWVRRQCGKKAESLAQGMIDVLRLVLGKCSSTETAFNFVICGWQVLQESPSLTMMANSGRLSFLGWIEQACHSGLRRFQSCIETKLEKCPGGVFVDIHDVIKAACASFSDIEPMSGCYLPVVDNIESACGINTGELLALSSMISRYTIDSTYQSALSKLATNIMQKSTSMKCAVQYEKNVTLSKLPQRCGSKLKYDVDHIFDLIDEIVEDVPKFINTSLQEAQAIINYMNHIVCSDTAKGMVQKCGGLHLQSSLNENSLFGTLLHNSRLNGFFNSPKRSQSSSHGLQRRFTRSLQNNAPNDIFFDSAFSAETVSNASVEKVCREYEAYEQCLDRTVDIFGCDTDSQIKSSWGYMCGKGKPDLMLSVSCLIELDVSVLEEWMKGPEADTCRAAQRELVASQNSSAADMMCVYRAYFAACLEAMAKSKCGQHASDFYSGLVNSVFERFVAHLQASDPSFMPTNDCI